MDPVRLVQWSTLTWLAPESILVLGASLLYLLAAFQPGKRQTWIVVAIALYLAAMAIKILVEGLAPPSVISGPLSIDGLGELTRWLALGGGLVVTLMLAHDSHPDLTGEQAATLMLAFAGAMVLGRANDLVLAFLALETVSIPTYILLFLGRRGRASSEATLKYFFLSVLSSGFLLYGFSFLYGMTGTTMIAGSSHSLHALLPQSSLAQLAPLALVFTLAGIGFKIAAVPFHFYAPDVYQGTSNTNAALLSVAPKVAGIVILARLVSVGLGPDWDLTWQTLLVLAIVTMTIGNVCALWQGHLRRLLAFSSIAHAGYMLIGLAAARRARVWPSTGPRPPCSIWRFTRSPPWVRSRCWWPSVRRTRQANDLKDLAGLSQRRPVMAAALAVCMFSLAGIPPLAGFWGKLALFMSSLSLTLDAQGLQVRSWFGVLSVVAAINAAIAAAYYLRVVASMYFGEAPRGAAAPPVAAGNPAAVAACLCALLVLAVGALPGLLFEQARQAGAFLRPSPAANTTALRRPDGEHWVP